MPASSSSSRISSERAKLRAFLAACVRRCALRPPRRRAPPLLRGGRQHVEDRVEPVEQFQRRRRRCRRGTRPHPWRVLVSRTYSKTAASASAVFRSSSSASSNASRGLRGARQRRDRCGPRGNLSVSRRSLKLRSRSMEVAAAFEPVEGEVQLLAIRHRGQQIAHRLGRVALAPAGRAACRKLPSDFDIFCPSTIRCSAVQPEARERLAGERSPTARFRFRDAGRSGRRRRRGCRAFRPDTSSP